LRLVRLGSTRLAVYTHGSVPGSFIEDCMGVLREVYGVAERRGEAPGLVELHLYEDRAALRGFLSGEAARLGVSVDAEFVVMHEAWTGVPRIHVPLDAWGSRWFRPLLGHEAVHNVLHGSLLYYVVEAPEPGGLGVLAAYAAAAVVKDLEVHVWARLAGLRWLLEGMRSYWLMEAGLGGFSCLSVEEVMDAARAATAWLAEGMEPPLSRGCRARLGSLLGLLRSAAGEWLGGGERPWSRVGEAAALLLEALRGVRGGG